MSLAALNRNLGRIQKAKGLLETVIQNPHGLDPEISPAIEETYGILSLLEENIQTLIDDEPPAVSCPTGPEIPANRRYREDISRMEQEEVDSLEEMTSRGNRLMTVKSLARR